MFRNHASDLIHGIVVAYICTLATFYSVETNDHSNNIWIVYGSAIAFAAGRAGVAAIRHIGTRSNDKDNEQP